MASPYGVQVAPMKTDRNVVNQECPDDVPSDTRGQLINLQAKTCNSKDTNSWNTFPWVEFIRGGGFESDWNSVIPEMNRHENRQFASDANPVQVLDMIMVRFAAKGE